MIYPIKKLFTISVIFLNQKFTKNEQLQNGYQFVGLLSEQ